MAMNQIFGEQYARAYDNLYRQKDYDGEVALLERVFGTYYPSGVRKILDLGCGTGNHAIRFAQRGYTVFGVDQSEEMLAVARTKAHNSSAPVRWICSSVEGFETAERFDAVIMMFAVLGYHTSNAAVLKALGTARRHLVSGGLFVCDVWYGPAVLMQRPGDRIRIVDTGTHTTLRATGGELDLFSQTCRVDYRLWELAEDRVIARTSETHIMRYFFPQELALFLDVAGFHLERIGAFPDWDRMPDETTWNVMVVASAR